jgi:glycosyltransferase involved in cell wall biosynthesis
MLRRAGYEVDVFLFRCGTHLHDVDPYDQHIHVLSGEKVFWNQQRNIIKKLFSAFIFFVLDPFRGSKALLSQEVLNWTEKQITERNFICFIGIEKLGLVWSGLLGIKYKIPFLYYSLELYPNSYLRFISPVRWLRFLSIRRNESRFHRLASAAIVQDERRGIELDRMNDVKGVPRIYLPVSVIGPPRKEKSNYLKNHLGITRDKVIVLQFGGIDKERRSVELTIASQEFETDVVMVFHGLAEDPTILDKIRKVDIKKKVVISTDLVPSERIDDLVCSADIGLCFYSDRSVNEITSGYSSEKLARYLRAGIPVIASDYHSFKQSVQDTGVGICIRDFSELAVAVQKIKKDYGKYQDRAFETYDKYFRFEIQFEKVVKYIQEL